MSISDHSIMCSAGKGEMSAKACLHCSLSSGHPPCGYEYGLLSTLFEVEFGDSRDGIHVTDLTGCLKKAYFKKTTKAPEWVHEMMARFLGTLFHGNMEDAGEADNELKLEAMGIVGRADRVYENGRVIDFKTTRWLKPSKLPYGSHELQVNIYAHLLRKMGRKVDSAAIQYVDMSGPTKCRRCRQVVRPDGNGVLVCPKCGQMPNDAHLGALLVEIPLMGEEEVDRYISNRRDILLKALEDETAPDGEPGFLCAGYCPFLEMCPEGLRYVN